MGLVVENISKSFGKIKVFDHLSFEVDAGSILCVEGKSGEGKTTLLRCLNKLEQVDEGSIFIDGENILQLKDARKIGSKIGLVFQNYNLFPHLTVMENLTITPNYLKIMNKEDVNLKAKKILKSLEIEDKENMYPYQLSGGQKQRVAIARACMLNPAVLCFDEPTSALDEDTSQKISSIIKNLANQGMAIIVVTHDIKFSRDISDLILKLEDGKLNRMQ
ncbi:amino acid ABC transporter ATP-binding protein [Soehngenia longivitae]|uniref:Amino acid ABC transporter ATP-binding protein n=1 Tax=Soehngenia longivitae TaxID=2562294 RepID=A0A4Z0D9Y3_9FIRM|nr:ATP-binding cassette domain-containing protein [Soehngenia longivitae]TFZ41687.1 amino acid ABC transporter ATP-binding protein [Soehngenia longivitae]